MEVLSVTQINKTVKSIKDQVRALDTKRLYYTIQVINPTTSSNLQTVISDNNRQDSCADRFSQQLDTLLNNADNVYIKVTLKDTRGKVLGEPEINLRTRAYSAPMVITPQPAAENPQEATAKPIDTPQGGVQNNLQGVLTLLGFGGLQGTDDGMGGLSSVLEVRDRLIRDQYERQDKERSLNMAMEERIKAQNRCEQLEKELKAANEEIDRLRDKVDELSDELDDAEEYRKKMSTPVGIGGAVLGEALGSVMTGLAKRNPRLGSLLGLDGTADTTQEEAAPLPEVSVQPVQADPLQQVNDTITAFTRTLNEADLKAFIEIVQFFYSDHQNIADTLAYLKDE